MLRGIALPLAVMAGLIALSFRPIPAQITIPTRTHSVNTIWHGAGAPANTLGTDGDFYIDQSAMVIYGPRLSGSWPSGLSLISNAGAQPAVAGTPASSSATCSPGQILYDSNFVYFCVATNTWVRTATGGGF